MTSPDMLNTRKPSPFAPSAAANREASDAALAEMIENRDRRDREAEARGAQEEERADAINAAHRTICTAEGRALDRWDCAERSLIQAKRDNELGHRIDLRPYRAAVYVAKQRADGCEAARDAHPSSVFWGWMPEEDGYTREPCGSDLY